MWTFSASDGLVLKRSGRRQGLAHLFQMHAAQEDGALLMSEQRQIFIKEHKGLSLCIFETPINENEYHYKILIKGHHKLESNVWYFLVSHAHILPKIKSIKDLELIIKSEIKLARVANQQLKDSLSTNEWTMDTWDKELSGWQIT